MILANVWTAIGWTLAIVGVSGFGLIGFLAIDDSRHKRELKKMREETDRKRIQQWDKFSE